MCHIAYVPECFCACQAFAFIAIFRLDHQSYQDFPDQSRLGQDLCTACKPQVSPATQSHPDWFRPANHSSDFQKPSYQHSSVATTASMDLTAVIPALMHGIAQEVGVEVSELKGDSRWR